MKKITILLAGIGMVAAAVPAAASAAPLGAPYGAAQGWQNINARQARIEAKINQGVRSGALDRREAVQLRSEFRGLVALEARYRASRPGLTLAERQDLDRRFDQLERRVFVEKHDRQGRRW
ncbi:MAG: hypothetical protein WDN44_12610 [Sphingomonas sp.]